MFYTNLTVIFFFRVTHSGRSSTVNKKSFSTEIEDHLIKSVQKYLKKKDCNDDVKESIITKLSNFNRLFQAIKNKQMYSQELVRQCKLSNDDVIYLKDLLDYIKDQNKFIELDFKIDQIKNKKKKKK